MLTTSSSKLLLDIVMLKLLGHELIKLTFLKNIKKKHIVYIQ